MNKTIGQIIEEVAREFNAKVVYPSKEVYEKANKRYPECPLFDMECPYCLASGECTIDNPLEECDDYYYYNGEEE